MPQYTAWEDYYVLKQRFSMALWKKMSKLMRRGASVMPSYGMVGNESSDPTSMMSGPAKERGPIAQEEDEVE